LQKSEITTEIFDTVLMATGRAPSTSLLNLSSIGVLCDEKSGKIIGKFNGHDETTSINHIFAIGDVLSHMPEL